MRAIAEVGQYEVFLKPDLTLLVAFEKHVPEAGPD